MVLQAFIKVLGIEEAGLQSGDGEIPEYFLHGATEVSITRQHQPYLGRILVAGFVEVQFPATYT